MVSSCTKDMEINLKEGQVSFSSIQASMGDLPTSRVHLENNGRMVWSLHDQVGVFSDTQTTPVRFTCTEINENYASFSAGDEVSGNNFIAYYPYENSSIDGNIFTCNLPNNTLYTEGSYFRQCPMIAKSNTNEFKFKHTCGIIRFSITGTKQILSLVLEGNNGEIIAGTGTIDFKSETPILAIPTDVSDASKTIEMYVGNIDTNTAKDFYFVVPHKEFSKGISLTLLFIDENGIPQRVKKSTFKSINVTRSVIKSFAVFDTDELIGL